MERRMVLGASIAFVLLIAVLTIADAVKHGPSVRTVVSIPIVALLAIGLIGAMSQPPEQ